MLSGLVWRVPHKEGGPIRLPGGHKVDVRFAGFGSLVEHSYDPCDAGSAAGSSGRPLSLAQGRHAMAVPSSPSLTRVRAGATLQGVLAAVRRDLRAGLAGVNRLQRPGLALPHPSRGQLPNRRPLAVFTVPDRRLTRRGIQALSSWTTLVAPALRHMALVWTARRNCEVSGGALNRSLQHLLT
jgi:hypothetical protein